MRLVFHLLFGASILISAPLLAEDSPSFIVIGSYNLRNFQEKTPESERKFLEESYLFTAAYRLPYGFSLGLSTLNQSKKAPETDLTLTANGISVGFVGSEYFSLLYTHLFDPALKYNFKTLKTSTSYFAGSGSMIDFGLHWSIGPEWLRLGPRVSLIEVNYRKMKVKSPSLGSESEDLELSPWRDRWIETYLGLWLMF